MDFCDYPVSEANTVADHLPEQASFDDAMHALYVRQKLERSQQAAEQGHITSQDTMENRYLSNTN